MADVLRDPDIIGQALSRIPDEELKKVFQSKTEKKAHPAVTKFAVAIAARCAEETAAKKVRASFSGKVDQKEMKDHAEAVCADSRLEHHPHECLLDVLATGESVLEVYLAVESEACSMTSPKSNAYDDLQKLLLVSSPRRLFIGRVNVTKTGKKTKLQNAAAKIEAAWKLALERGHCTQSEEFGVIILQTDNSEKRIVHVGTVNMGKLEFRCFDHSQKELPRSYSPSWT